MHSRGIVILCREQMHSLGERHICLPYKGLSTARRIVEIIAGAITNLSIFNLSMEIATGDKHLRNDRFLREIKIYIQGEISSWLSNTPLSATTA